MALQASGDIVGTIGGGKLEAVVIQSLSQVIVTGRAGLISLEFSGADAASMDMICGGSVKVLLEKISPERVDFWTSLRQARQADGWLSIALDLGGRTNYSFYTDQAELLSKLPAAMESNGLANPVLLENDGEIQFIEPVTKDVSLHIFGAGHVGQALANIAHTVGFRCVVYDDRDEYANRSRFPGVDEVIVAQKIDDAHYYQGLGQRDFIVIVTRGHQQDRLVLERSLASNAGYIGMIGSRRKNRLIFDALLAEGFTREDIQRVHAPIGLDIKAETPEEIAVSILAELIVARAQLTPSRDKVIPG